MKQRGILMSAACALAAGCAQMDTAKSPTSGATVKITPLGSHDGEFCPVDRALVFEDPDGTRLLYDAGRTVRGRTIRGSERSTRYCSATSTATTSATQSPPRPTPVNAQSPPFR